VVPGRVAVIDCREVLDAGPPLGAASPSGPGDSRSVVFPDCPPAPLFLPSDVFVAPTCLDVVVTFDAEGPVARVVVCELGREVRAAGPDTDGRAVLGAFSAAEEPIELLVVVVPRGRVVPTVEVRGAGVVPIDGREEEVAPSCFVGDLVGD
jgi:hypothetical protein